MTPEELKELKEKAELWDSLSPTLKTIYAPQYIRTIENTSNASTHIDVLKEEMEDLKNK